MLLKKPIFLGLTLLTISLVHCFSYGVQANSDPKQGVTEMHKLYTDKGADTCLKCHDEDNEYPIMPIFKSKHGHESGSLSPFAGLECESCHGPGQAHAQLAKKTDELRGSIINFGKGAITATEIQDSQCLTCHQNDERNHWLGNAHEQQDVGCVGCHKIHVVKDPIMQPNSESKICLSCHTKQASQLHKRSTHPLKYNQMQCSSCHQPHGSVADMLLIQPNINETCYTCHAEKRGPFLWQHAPVDEDCTQCHNPHGSNQESLLTKRIQLLCRECHSPAGHPSLAPSGTGLPNQRHSGLGKFISGKSCLNCHSQIHGSNHPSGSKLTR